MASPFHRRPLPDYFFASPLAAIVYPLHHLLNRLRGPPHLPPPDSRPIRVVCISDTHTLECSDVPDGDLLIHAGDLCNDGSVREIQASVDWLRSLPHRHKVVICGNHDSYFDVRSRLTEDRDTDTQALSSSTSFAAVSSSTASLHTIDDPVHHRIDWGDNTTSDSADSSSTTHKNSPIHYLQHSSITLTFPATQPGTRARSLTIYGAPHIPAIVPFGPEHAFTYPPHHDAWSGTVPPNTDILITHTPPAAHLDLSPVYSTGCPYLLSEAWRVRPTLHVFGHVHAAYGMESVYWDEAQKAWERLCAARRRRARSSRLGSFFLGLLRDLLDLSGWMDSARVVAYGVLGVIWARVWGGDNRGCGWMVNAACMYRDSGRLANKPQTVVL